MTGTVVVAETNHGGFCKIKYSWTCTSAGDASDVTTKSYNGQLMRAIFDSAADVTAAYDVVVTDTDGYDVLNGLGANLSESTTVQKTNVDGLGCIGSSTLTMTVSAAGDAKTGVVILYLLPIDNPS